MVLIDFNALDKLPNRLDHKNKLDAMRMFIVFIHDLLIISWKTFYSFYYFSQIFKCFYLKL